MEKCQYYIYYVLTIFLPPFCSAFFRGGANGQVQSNSLTTGLNGHAADISEEEKGGGGGGGNAAGIGNGTIGPIMSNSCGPLLDLADADPPVENEKMGKERRMMNGTKDEELEQRLLISPD
jgi:hypothetical protein